MRVSLPAALLFSLLTFAAGAGSMYVYLSHPGDANRPARREAAAAEQESARPYLKTASVSDDRSTQAPHANDQNSEGASTAEPTKQPPSDVSAKASDERKPDAASATPPDQPAGPSKTSDEALKEAAVKAATEAAKKEIENLGDLGLDELLAKRVDFNVEVSGTVVDSRGNPVPGADVFADINERLGDRGAMMVTFNDLGDKIATTDNGGAFTATVKAKVGEKSQVTLILRARAKGYAESKRLSVDAKSGDSKTGLRLVLPGAGSVRGRVIDQQGSAIAGVTVSLSPQRGSGVTYGEEVILGGQAKNAGVTDASGSYEIVDMAEGSYSLNLRAPGWREKSGPRVVDVKPDQVSQVETDFVLVPTTCLRARLCDADGKPISGWATVELTPASGGSVQRLNAMVGEDGLLAVNEPPIGEYNVTVKLWGYLDSAQHFAVLTQDQTTDLGVLTLAVNPEARKTTTRVRIGKTEK